MGRNKLWPKEESRFFKIRVKKDVADKYQALLKIKGKTTQEDIYEHIKTLIN
jgi:hypothetical protein